MRSTSALTMTALATVAAFGLCLGGCSKGEQAASTYHPAPAAWYAGQTATAGNHAAQSTSMPGEEGFAPGTTRATAGFGGTGGGPSNGTDGKTDVKKPRGHVDGSTGIANDGAAGVSRTGKK